LFLCLYFVVKQWMVLCSQVLCKAAAALPEALKACCITAVLQAAGSSSSSVPLTQGVPKLPAAAAAQALEAVVHSISSSASATAACVRSLVSCSDQDQQLACIVAFQIAGLLCCCSSSEGSVLLSSSDFADAVAAVQACLSSRPATARLTAALSDADNVQGLVQQIDSMSLSAAPAKQGNRSNRGSSKAARPASSSSKSKGQEQQPQDPEQQLQEQHQQQQAAEEDSELQLEVAVWCLKQLVDCGLTGGC
jgi:hypothetical protein